MWPVSGSEAVVARMMRGACLLLILVQITGFSRNGVAIESNGASLLHQHAPDFTRPDVLDHRPIRLSAFRGRVVLLNFWATWCAPCLAEMPTFSSWQQRYSAAGLQTIGVSMDDSVDAAEATTRRLSIHYPVVMDDEKLGTSFGGILGLPLTILIDRKGLVAGIYPYDDLAHLEIDIKRLTNQP